jgi:hypothetical protein
MLQTMPQSAAPAPSPTPPSFAGLLASFAEPEKKFPPARETDGLADDIATLSYEHALRTHARYRPVGVDDGSPGSRIGSWPAVAAPPITRLGAPAESPSLKAAVAAPVPTRVVPAAVEQNLKRASITIRLSRSESAQLHQRAAEAGLTVSAYLRSCTFEVESLRAQVKETLAQLRSATANQPSAQPDQPNQSPRPAAKPQPFFARMWLRLWPYAARRTARA